MAILGRYIDQQTVSRAGDALSGLTLATLSHSLPATNPEMVLPILRSVQGIGHNPSVSVLGLGGNASIATVGYLTASTASAPTVMYDLFCATLHTIIR